MVWLVHWAFLGSWNINMGLIEGLLTENVVKCVHMFDFSNKALQTTEDTALDASL